MIQADVGGRRTCDQQVAAYIELEALNEEGVCEVELYHTVSVRRERKGEKRGEGGGK